MSTFLQLKRDCPICSGARRDCRQSRDTGFIHCRDAQANPVGFRFIGEDSIGFFMWAEDSQVEAPDWQDKLEARRQKQQAEQQQKLKRVLPVAERDRQFRSVARHSGLSVRHRSKLEQRGLSPDLIEQAYNQSLLCSWQSGATIPGTTADLPGVDARGRLRRYPDGIAIAAPNERGEILGVQLRADAPSPNNPRYRWLSSEAVGGNSIHLPDGEVPIGFYRPLTGLGSGAINIAEGFLKPFVIAQRHGVICLGAAGANFSSSPQLLQRYLEAASAELNTKQVVLNADAGSVSNPSILGAYRRLCGLAEDWGYTVYIRWWGQAEKSAGDADEIDAATFANAELLTVEQFDELSTASGTEHIGQAQQNQRFLDRVLNLVKRASNKVKGGKPKGFAPQVIAAEHLIHEYEPGHRLETWQQAREQGYRYVLDLTGTGEGKSYDAGNAEPERFKVRQLAYLSSQHRNVTVETLTRANGWLDLEARHAGLTKERTGEGYRLKRSGKDDSIDVPANCSRNNLLSVLRAKNIHGADSASLICGTCPLREACSNAEGRGFGYLHQRRITLASPKLTAHPDSLPSPTDYDYCDVGLIWDEAEVNFKVKKPIEVKLSDLQQLMATLVVNQPELLTQLQPLLTALLPYLDGTHKTGLYGLKHQEVVSTLQALVEIDPLMIEQALYPNLNFVNTTEEHGVNLQDLPPQLRKKFTERDSEMAEQAQHQVLKQWLSELMRVLRGEISGATLLLHQQKLSISLPDLRHRSIAQATSFNIFLSATLSREDAALLLGCTPDEIFVCRQKPKEVTNLHIKQVTDMGRMGMQRGKEQERRLAAIHQHLERSAQNLRTIDYKKYSADSAWWRDSRGVNDFLSCQTLVLAGTPCINLNEQLAEYRAMTGSGVSEEDEQFKGWVDRRIRGEFQQAIGRLRANRRPDDQLTIYIISDFDLQLPQVEQVTAAAITPEAAGKFEQFKNAVLQAGHVLAAEGRKITQTALAAVSGYSQQYISEHWKLLQTLLGSLIAKVVKISAQSEQVEEVAEIAPIVEAVCAESPPEIIIEALEKDFYEWVKPKQWSAIWQKLTYRAKTNLLAALIATLPPATIAQMQEVI